MMMMMMMENSNSNKSDPDVIIMRKQTPPSFDLLIGAVCYGIIENKTLRIFCMFLYQTAMRHREILLMTGVRSRSYAVNTILLD